MEIRFAQKQDIPRLLTLLKQIGALHAQGRPDIFRPDAQKYQASDLEEILSDPTLPVFVAVEQGAVTGYCFCVIKSTRPGSAMANRKDLYIDDLCVDENCRQKGIGAALYRHAVAYAKQIRCNAVTLNVWAFNENAMAFYNAMGMKIRNMTMEYPLEGESC